MPSFRRLVEVLTNRRLPFRTRLDLLRRGRAQDARAARDCTRVRYGAATRLSLEHDDYDVDWASFSVRGHGGIYDVPYRRTPSCSTSAPTRATSAHTRSRTAQLRSSRTSRRTANARSARADRHRVVDATAQRVDDSSRVAVDATCGRRRAPRHGGILGTRARAAGELGGARGRDRVGGRRGDSPTSSRASRSHSAGRRLVVKVNIEGAECSAILGTPPRRGRRSRRSSSRRIRGRRAAPTRSPHSSSAPASARVESAPPCGAPHASRRTASIRST